MPDVAAATTQQTPERSLVDYIRPLGKHTLLVALVIMMGAILGLTIGVLSAGSAPYEAEAVVLFQPTERLTLTSDSDNIEQNVIDLTRQRNTIKVLISSVDVAEKVYQRGQSSNESEIQAFVAPIDILELRDAVEVDSRADLISISAKGPTPLVATWLANAWAEEAMSKINRVYASSASSGVTEALDRAKSELDQAEQSLQRFLATNPINALVQEQERTDSFLGAAASSDIASRLALYDNERSIIREQVAAGLNNIYDLDQRIADIGALRSRIEQGPDNEDTLYANQIALLSLLNNLALGGPALQLQLDINNADLSEAPRTKANQLEDIDATIAALQKLQQDLRERTTTLESKLSEPLPEIPPGQIQNVPAVVREQIELRNQLAAKIEEKQFELGQLQKTRDLRQSAYDLLRSRVAEQEVNDVISRVVNIGSPANLQETLESRNLLRSIAITTGILVALATLLVLALACALAFLRPTLNTNVALKRAFASRRRRPRSTDRPQEQATALD